MSNGVEFDTDNSSRFVPRSGGISGSSMPGIAPTGNEPKMVAHEKGYSQVAAYRPGYFGSGCYYQYYRYICCH
jgi:hypothetical protein